MCTLKTSFSVMVVVGILLTRVVNTPAKFRTLLLVLLMNGCYQLLITGFWGLQILNGGLYFDMILIQKALERLLLVFRFISILVQDSRS